MKRRKRTRRQALRALIDAATKVDSNGVRVAPGDKVAFHLDPKKAWKRPSMGIVRRWVGDRVCEVEYRGLSTADHGRYDLGSDEITLAEYGAASQRARETVPGRNFL